MEDNKGKTHWYLKNEKREPREEASMSLLRSQHKYWYPQNSSLPDFPLQHNPQLHFFGDIKD
jgi:hypothetical protein